MHAGKRVPSARRRIVARMKDAFESEGVWGLMRKEIAAETYTYKGDPLKIDCAYRPNGTIKMFQAVAFGSDVDSAKVLAFSHPQLVAGIARELETMLTAILEDGLDEKDESIMFAMAMMQGAGIAVSAVEDLPSIAKQARIELRL